VNAIKELKKQNMRIQMIFILTILLTAGASTMALAEIPEIFGSGIESSCHNFSHLSWLPTSKTCHVCHTVHKEALPRKQYPNGLLWKRDVDSVSYNLYNSFDGKKVKPARWHIKALSRLS
jgi:hypothetical protein